MAGMGPPPKDPKIRQRRNRTSTRAVLPADPDQVGKAVLSPKLPARGKNEKPWHPKTREYWREVWASPMALEYVKADVPNFEILAELVDRFWYGEINLAGEIRLQRACFGLTPLDRRRLEWSIESESAAQKRREQKHAPAPTGTTGGGYKDPRRALRAVK